MRFRRKRNRLFRKFAFVIPIAFTLAILWVWKSTVATELSQELTRLDQTKRSMAEQNRRMTADLEHYRSVAWVDPIVRTRLGMTYDIKNRIVLFDNKITKPPRASKGLYASLTDNLRDVWRYITGGK